MKRVLVKQGYSLDQLVAIMGCLRSIGFHDSANFHTKEEIKPSFRNTGVVGPKAGDFVIPDTTEKTTLDPYVFGSDYFDLLLDYNWKKGIFSNSSVFRCSAKDKRRDIVLLDPFSARTAESIGELEKAKEKAQNDSDSFYQKKNAVMSGENPEQLGKYGRTGEAQFIPGPKANEIVELSNDFMDEEEGVSVDPCEHVSMKGIDVMLLDDGLTTGWLHKFSSSELEFYAAVTEVVLDIQNRGHNVNNLYLPRK
ncbi:hypothetical protein AGDE_04163 [Angomonas deanei]|nr:hypothetical protein AGDE_04163 [Angomonas deanei]|eukprot:EPY39765.1 hypothetical protein AGDE_04163 [Angomonas deanei]